MVEAHLIRTYLKPIEKKLNWKEINDIKDFYKHYCMLTQFWCPPQGVTSVKFDGSQFEQNKSIFMNKIIVNGVDQDVTREHNNKSFKQSILW